MGSGMGGGIEKQQHYYTQPGKVAVHQQQMQKSTGLAGLTGGKSQKADESKSKSEDKFVGGGEGEATEGGKEASAQHGGALVGGFLKTGSKERKTTVGRKMASDDTEVEEDSEVSESSSTSSVNKTGMTGTRAAGDVRVKGVSGGRRHSDSGDLTVDFINDWLRIKKSPGAKLSLGEIMAECGQEQNVEPFILLAISATETEYGKKGAGLDGLMGIEDIEGPEEQIVEGAKLFSQLRENDESDEDAPVANQLISVNRAGWCDDLNWHKSVFKYYQEIKRAWERYSEMKS